MMASRRKPSPAMPSGDTKMPWRPDPGGRVVRASRARSRPTPAGPGRTRSHRRCRTSWTLSHQPRGVCQVLCPMFLVLGPSLVLGPVFETVLGPFLVRGPWSAHQGPGTLGRTKPEEPGPWTPRRSRAQAALDQRVDRVDAIDPANLLSFILATRLVPDGDFQNPAPGPEHLGRDLGLEIEAHAAEADAIERFPFEHFVGRLHVGQPRAEQNIGQHREETIGETPPESDVAGRGQEPRAVDDLRTPFEDRGQQPSVLVRIELEVRVLHEEDVPGREAQSQ